VVLSSNLVYMGMYRRDAFEFVWSAFCLFFLYRHMIKMAMRAVEIISKYYDESVDYGGIRLF